jgi:hypothetical protein
MLVELVETSAGGPMVVAVREERQGWLVAVGDCGGRLKTVRAGRSVDGRPLESPPETTWRK